MFCLSTSVSIPFCLSSRVPIPFCLSISVPIPFCLSVRVPILFCLQTLLPASQDARWRNGDRVLLNLRRKHGYISTVHNLPTSIYLTSIFPSPPSLPSSLLPPFLPPPSLPSRAHLVPSVLLSTSELPSGLTVRGKGCFIQARVCYPKKKIKGDENAFQVSKVRKSPFHRVHCAATCTRTVYYIINAHGRSSLGQLQ